MCCDVIADVTFLIHGIVEGSDAEDEQATFDRLSALGQRVVVRQDVLAQEEYAAWLARADLVLLPYDRKVYKSRGSGVFTEAQRLGIPVIATEGCAFAQPAFEGGWGVEITDYSSEGVARAVLAALGGLDELSARAGDRRPARPATRSTSSSAKPPTLSGHRPRRACRQDQTAYRTKFSSPAACNSRCIMGPYAAVLARKMTLPTGTLRGSMAAASPSAANPAPRGPLSAIAGCATAPGRPCRRRWPIAATP